MTGRRARAAVIGGSAVAACAVAVGCDTPVVEVGAPAPPYHAVTLAGDSISLDSLRGDVVLLNIWATWCHPCREEIPVLEALHERHASSGLRVVGVSIDSPGEEARVTSFANNIGMTYPVWYDSDDRISTVYQAIGVPSTYLIDRHGILRWRRLGQLRSGDPGLTRELAAALGEPADSVPTQLSASRD
jgi:thiol-disulfide isomerase/thioredoxin